MKIQQMSNGNGGTVKNQFVVDCQDGRYFQSYTSVIVKVHHGGRIELDERFWDYSKTTSKYRNRFLGETTKQIKDKIKTGEYTLTDLNSGVK
jgi:hypothetical protein